MSFRTRIYETTNLGNGRRMVTSGTVSDYWFMRLCGLVLKIFVVWPIKLVIIWPIKIGFRLLIWCIKLIFAIITLPFKKIFGK